MYVYIEFISVEF